jgi:hypothetical protein
MWEGGNTSVPALSKTNQTQAQSLASYKQIPPWSSYLTFFLICHHFSHSECMQLLWTGDQCVLHLEGPWNKFQAFQLILSVSAFQQFF